MKETILKIKKTESWFFEKMDKTFNNSSRKKERRIKSTKLESKKGEFTIDNSEIQRIIRDYFVQLYVNKMDNLQEMNRFLEKFNLPRLTRNK